MTAGFSGLNEVPRNADGTSDSNMAIAFGQSSMAGTRIGGSSVFDDYYDFYRLGLF